MNEYDPMNYDCQPVEEPRQQPYQEQRPYNYEPYNQPQKPKKPKKDRTTLKVVLLIAAVALVASMAGSILTGVVNNIKDNSEGESVSAPQEIDPPAEDAEAEGEGFVVKTHKLPDTLNSNDAGKGMTLVEVYDRTVNSVVGIETELTTNAFGQEAVAASAGSGFILSEDGYVITNAHVVNGADTIKVNLFDGTSYDAKLVGADTSFDIAVLKVEAQGLPAVSVGNSDELKVGEQVAAIGNPLGELTFTMTSGILSALDREINTDGNVQNMLQTNAAINSGNSGGPLFDMNGNVIGVTTAKYSGATNSGTYIEGLGFAIPINTALKVAYDLAEYGYVKGQAYLGITVKTLATDTADYYGLPTGPRVEAINEGSCAQKAGMEVGDIIIEFNGVKTETHPELLSALKKVQAGDTVEVKIFRAGAEMSLTLTLDERPRQEEIDQQLEEYNQSQQPEASVEPEPAPGQDGSQYYYYQFPFGFGN